MRKVVSVLAEVELACQDVLEAVSVAKEKKARVDVAAAEEVVEKLRQFEALLEGALGDEEEEVVEEVEEPVKEKRKRKERKEGGKAASVEPRREKKAAKKAKEVEEVEDEPVPQKEQPLRKRQVPEEEEEEQEEQEEILPSVKKAAKDQVKNGGVGRGPDGELVFYYASKGVKSVACPVFGSEREEIYGAKSLVACDVDALEEEEQNWACAKLYEVYADQIQRATKNVASPLEVCARAHSCLHNADDGQMIFVNEHANEKGVNPELLGVVRDAQQAAVNAGVCEESIYYMMAAKLHEELNEVVVRGELTKQFRDRLSKMCNLYEIELKPSTLERYLPAGRMMLRCRPLAFVNVMLLLTQQKLTEKIVEDEEMVAELSRLAASKSVLLLEDISVPNVDRNSIAATVFGLMKHLRSVAFDDLAVTKVNASLSALDFTRILRMRVDNKPVGSLTPSVVEQYASLLNTSLVAAGLGGWCLMENFRVDRVPPKLDWVAVACCEGSIGVFLNYVEKKVVAHVYEPSDEESVHEDVNKVAEKLKFPKKYQFKCEQVGGYEDAGMLHWLSRMVWGKERDANFPVELVRLQVAFELFVQELVPPERFFLSVIAEQQQPLELEVSVGKDLHMDSLTKSGFCVMLGFLPNKLCGEEAVLELCVRVKQCKKLEIIFQGAVLNDSRRMQASVSVMQEECEFGDELQALLDAVSRRLGKLIPSRSTSDVMALLSLEGCGPQRPHADYTRQSLEGIEDDGFCDGLPLGVVIALQPNTHFDVWPGAVNWDESRFYEHQQLTLGVGDAVFFLGNAVHAGAAFEQESVRLHCYLDSADVEREPDTTCFMDVAAGVGNILPRGAKIACFQ